MLKFPLFVLYAILAFNITAFAALLQLDVLIIHSAVAKAVTWIFAIAAWGLAYLNRHKFLTFRYDDRKGRAGRG